MLRHARSGIFPLNRMQEYTENYIKAGGTRSFSEYYTAKYDGALFNSALTKNVELGTLVMATPFRNAFHILRGSASFSLSWGPPRRLLTAPAEPETPMDVAASAIRTSTSTVMPVLLLGKPLHVPDSGTA